MNAEAEKKDYDLSELEISFDRISSTVAKAKVAGVPGEEGQAEESAAIVTPESILSEQEQKIKEERDKQVFEAKRQYNFNFFKNFAFSGPDALTMTQRSLEEFIMNTDNAKDIQLLVMAMTTSAYEINTLIPNIEMVFYKMFCSPITTKEMRQGKDGSENILLGNIFA